MFTDFSVVDPVYGTDRFKEQLIAFKKAFTLARENKAELILGGDLFHKRGSVDVKIFNMVYDIIHQNNDIVTHILRGNHDSNTNSLKTESSIDTFNYIPNVTVYSNPYVFKQGDTQLVFLPYGDEIDDMKNFINQSLEDEKPKTSILIAHLGVEGATQGRYSHRLSGAFSYNDLHPEYFDFILLGHYHKRQMIADNPNHFYGGSFMQHNFGDEGQDKGYHLIDTDKKTTTFIPSEARKFLTIEGNNLPDNLEEVISDNFVRFQGDTNDVRAIENIRAQGVDIPNMRIELKRDYSKEARSGLDPTMSDYEIVEAYTKDKYPNATEIALECIREAM